jgi:mRNA deadenylase 3'-5' endonuclease subunit Ccr4
MVNKSPLNEKQISMLKNSMRAFGEEDSGKGCNSEKKEIQSTSITSKDIKDIGEVTTEESISSSSQLLSEAQTSQNPPSLKPQLESLSTLLSNFENLPKCLSLYGQNYHLIDSENIKDSEPKVTNYGTYFKGTLDYIFLVLNRKEKNEESKMENDNKVVKANNKVKVKNY